MWRKLGAIFGVLVLASAAQAGAIVDVTSSINASLVDGKYRLTLGEKYTLSVFGQLKESAASSDNGIFSWDVDLRVGDTSVLSLLTATVDRTGWEKNPSTSSSGTPTTWGLNAIYDAAVSNTELGIGTPVRLFSVNFTAAKRGLSTLAIQPDDTIGADFFTWTSDSSSPVVAGDYSLATATINVVPEPNSLFLIIAAALSLSVFWLKRSL